VEQKRQEAPAQADQPGTDREDCPPANPPHRPYPLRHPNAHDPDEGGRPQQAQVGQKLQVETIGMDPLVPRCHPQVAAIEPPEVVRPDAEEGPFGPHLPGGPP